jgi:hypothetical protein
MGARAIVCTRLVSATKVDTSAGQARGISLWNRTAAQAALADKPAAPEKLN